MWVWFTPGTERLQGLLVRITVHRVGQDLSVQIHENSHVADTYPEEFKRSTNYRSNSLFVGLQPFSFQTQILTCMLNMLQNLPRLTGNMFCISAKLNKINKNKLPILTNMQFPVEMNNRGRKTQTTVIPFHTNYEFPWRKPNFPCTILCYKFKTILICCKIWYFLTLVSHKQLHVWVF